jgi:hypothetical protein
LRNTLLISTTGKHFRKTVKKDRGSTITFGTKGSLKKGSLLVFEMQVILPNL